MSCIACGIRLISEQLLMALTVNKQVNSDSQQIWDLLRDRWAAVFSLLHTHTHEHSWRCGVEALTQVALTRTCHHLTLHSYNQLACQLHSVTDSLAHNDTCVCLPTNLHTHSYGTEVRLLRHLCICTLACSTPPGVQRYMWTAVHEHVLLCSLTPRFSPDSELRSRKDNWNDCHTSAKRMRLEDDGKWRRQWEWKWRRGGRHNSSRWIDKESQRRNGERELSRKGDSPGETSPSLVLEHGRQRSGWCTKGVKGTQHQISERLPCQTLL